MFPCFSFFFLAFQGGHPVIEASCAQASVQKKLSFFQVSLTVCTLTNISFFFLFFFFFVRWSVTLQSHPPPSKQEKKKKFHTGKPVNTKKPKKKSVIQTQAALLAREKKKCFFPSFSFLHGYRMKNAFTGYQAHLFQPRNCNSSDNVSASWIAASARSSENRFPKCSQFAFH